MDADRAIAALAERQPGLVTRAQALERGLTESAIGRRLAAGRWKRVHSGVYRLAGAERTWEQELRAHLLPAGPGAVVSPSSAATPLGPPSAPGVAGERAACSPCSTNGRERPGRPGVPSSGCCGKRSAITACPSPNGNSPSGSPGTAWHTSTLRTLKRSSPSKRTATCTI